MNGEYIYEKYDPKLLKEMAQKFNVENMNLYLLSQDEQKEETEKWYQTKFRRNFIDQKIISSLKNPSLSPLQFVPPLHLPHNNIFIPSLLTVKNNEKKNDFPVKIRENNYSRAFHKQDTIFKAPKGNFYLFRDVVETVFSYLSILKDKGIDEETFEQVKLLEGLNFEYKGIKTK